MQGSQRARLFTFILEISLNWLLWSIAERRLNIGLLDDYSLLFEEPHENVKAVLVASFSIEFLSLLELLENCLRSLDEVNVHEGVFGHDLPVEPNLLLREAEANRGVEGTSSHHHLWLVGCHEGSCSHHIHSWHAVASHHHRRLVVRVPNASAGTRLMHHVHRHRIGSEGASLDHEAGWV